MREELLLKIRQAVEVDNSAPPVVALDEYFIGNEQEDCIAPNQIGEGRPSLVELYQRFRNISQRMDVQAVLVGIHDDWVEAEEYADLWPAGDCIHIYTSSNRAVVETWIEGLASDGVLKGWPRGKHKSAPQPKNGFQVFTIVWD